MTPETIVFGRFEKAPCNVTGNTMSNSLSNNFLESSKTLPQSCFSPFMDKQAFCWWSWKIILGYLWLFLKRMLLQGQEQKNHNPRGFWERWGLKMLHPRGRCVLPGSFALFPCPFPTSLHLPLHSRQNACLLSGISSAVTDLVAPHLWSSFVPGSIRWGRESIKGMPRCRNRCIKELSSVLLVLETVNKRVSKDWQNRRWWMLVSSCEVIAALVQLLMAAFPEPEHSLPILSTYTLPLAVHQGVLKENISTFLLIISHGCSVL